MYHMKASGNRNIMNLATAESTTPTVATTRRATRLNNRQMLVLNNEGVELIGSGHAFMAFQSFTRAASMLPKRLENDDTHFYDQQQIYRYTYTDCEGLFQSGLPDITLRQSQGCIAFIKKTFITSYAINVNEAAGFPLFGFAWAVRFNLATLCCIYGTCLGEQGRHLFQQASLLLDQLQVRLDQEFRTPNRLPHWNFVQLAVLNNRACIAHENGRRRDALRYLDEMANLIAVLRDNGTAEENELSDFLLTIELLDRSTDSAGAA